MAEKRILRGTVQDRTGRRRKLAGVNRLSRGSLTKQTDRKRDYQNDSK